MGDFIEKFGAIIIVVILLSVAATFIGTNTSFFQDADSAALTSVPFNITLSRDFVQSVLNVSNGTVVLPVTTNYTLDVTDELNPFVTILDNTSWNGTVTVDYEYRQGSYIRPAIAVIIAVLVILVAVALVIFGSKGIGKKRE